MKNKYYPGHPFIEKVIIEGAKNAHVVIDCFAGMGGTSSGFEAAENYYVIACINHWDKAIETHKLNHPNCLHLQEDFRTVDLSLLVYMVNKIRLINKHTKVHVWNSLECTNFSNAKGGMSRDADSRTLADHVDRYVIALNPDVIWIENVKEFLIWGGMIPKIVHMVKGKTKQIFFNPDKDDESIFNLHEGAYCPLELKKGKKKEKNKIISIGPWMIPDPARKGNDFHRWRNHIKSFGYESDHRLLNCADYGVPQHRVRLFMEFTRKGIGSFYPTITHNKKGTDGLSKWNPIKDCLDLKDEGTELLSFNNNKKTGIRTPRIKSKKTIERLMRGCIKHVFNGESIFVTKHYSGSPDSKNYSLDDIAGSVTGTGGNATISKVNLVDYYFGKGYSKPMDVPAGVTGARDGAALNTVMILDQTFGKSKPIGINNIAPSLTGISKANPITYTFLDQRFSGGGQNKGVNTPSSALTGVPKIVPINVSRFVMDTQFNNESHSLERTAGTVTANRKHYYVVNFQWCNGNSRDIAQASNTIIARMDKAPSYLIVTELGNLAIEVYDYDPPHYIAMKKFMAENGIVSIKMRMLKETELLLIQDLPATYKLTKSSTDNKKMIGNAVPRGVVKLLAEAFDKGTRKAA